WKGQPIEKPTRQLIKNIGRAYTIAMWFLQKCNAEWENIQSEIFLSPTNAISSVYQKIMKTAIKFSGPAIMGFDNPIIFNILIQDLPFQMYVFILEKLQVWILGIGKLSKSEWNYAGTSYKAAFIYMYQKQQCIFFEEFDDDKCKLIIYNKQIEVSKTFTNIDPDLLWKQVNCLQQYNGKKLFGLEKPHTQNLTQSIKIPTCSLDKWNNNQIMECVYNYHLKRRLSTYVNWFEWFNQWQEETLTIIEL
ncbi:5163_t:CDS:2, partial [Dentiscutata erythropus]